MRAGDYKLIEWYENGAVELYNLRDDISEKKDLAEKMPEKAAELKAMLGKWLKQVDAKMPASGPRDDFAVFEKAWRK